MRRRGHALAGGGIGTKGGRERGDEEGRFGKRGCPGKNLALRTLYFMLCMLIFEYEFVGDNVKIEMCGIAMRRPKKQTIYMKARV